MKRILIGVLLLPCTSAYLMAQSTSVPAFGITKTGFTEGVNAAIQKHLGRPYVWGAAGMKSFDCSGFIWRVLYENGVMMKRTTARKLYMMLPKQADADRWSFGTLVFFDNLKHVGIVDTSAEASR